MAEIPKPTKQEDEIVQVPQSVLTKIQESISQLETDLETERSARAGLQEIIESGKGVEASGDTPLREKKSFEPKFRTVRLRKYPIANDHTNLGLVVGWSNRGAYQTVDRTGVSPQIVDMIDIIFYGRERDSKSGKLQAEAVRLLDLLNKGEPVICKVLDQKIVPRKAPTGEEIDVSIFDPAHGLVATGDKVDGYVTFSDITYTLQVPDIKEPVVVDGTYVN